MKVSVYRKEHFNAAHRLHNEQLSDYANKQMFGKCNYPNYHGHNYELIVQVTGEVDPVSGYVIDLKILSDLIREKIIEPFDHRNLNVDVPEFSQRIPTAENIAVVIYDRLRSFIPEDKQLRIRLYETERNFVEYPAQPF